MPALNHVQAYDVLLADGGIVRRVLAVDGVAAAESIAGGVAWRLNRSDRLVEVMPYIAIDGGRSGRRVYS